MFSFRAEDSIYVYYGLRSNGAIEMLEGRPEGDRWIFVADIGRGASQQRKRVTISRTADGAFRFLEQTALGDTAWSRGDEIRFVRVADETP
jgi:hypothetical protein